MVKQKANWSAFYLKPKASSSLESREITKIAIEFCLIENKMLKSKALNLQNKISKSINDGLKGDLTNIHPLWTS